MTKHPSWSVCRRSYGKQAQLLLLLLLVTACASPPQPQASGASGSVSPSPTALAAEKLALSLRSVVQRMQQDGVTAANVTTRQAEAYSTPLVRVDHTGRLHVVLLVTLVDEQVQSLLLAHQARLEIADAELRLIQAWVPFDRLEDVAALPVVRYVRPPSYVMRH
jgi:hypothetical protein